MTTATETSPKSDTQRPAGAMTLSFMERLRKGDEAAYLITICAALTVVLITGLLAEHLWVNSALSRHQSGLRFLWSSDWDPGSNIFGALPFIYGTLVTSVLSLAIAIPIGLGAAIFLAEMAPRKLSDILTFLVELLAA
ncbi:MAG: phosphate ABC transporter permease subunit PstC, partial [Terriglobus sp.]